MKPTGNQASDHSEADAVAWYVRNEAREDDVDEATVRRWHEWWDDPENRTAYLSIVEMGREASFLPRPKPASDEDLLKDMEEDFSSSHDELASDQKESRQPWYAHLTRRSNVIAVSVALTAVVGSLMLFRDQWMDAGQSFATAVGEQRTFRLEDGSTITLGGNTSVNVRFTWSGRMIVLTRGEGMFRVQHEADRPFSVCAASGCTTAVGTVFDVRLYSTHTRVWVQEGAVVVTRRDTADAVRKSIPELNLSPPVRLASHQAVNYDASGGTSEIVVTDPLTAAGWTSGSLVYLGRPLSEVLEDVQRYTSRKLSVDASDAGLLYSGSVLQQHVEQWIRGLPHIFPVEVIDCHILRQSIGTDSEDQARACLSDPDRIVIRARQS